MPSELETEGPYATSLHGLSSVDMAEITSLVVARCRSGSGMSELASVMRRHGGRAGAGWAPGPCGVRLGSVRSALWACLGWGRARGRGVGDLVGRRQCHTIMRPYPRHTDPTPRVPTSHMRHATTQETRLPFKYPDRTIKG